MQKEILEYKAPWPLYAMDCNNNNFQFALGSFVEEFKNKLQVVSLNNDNQLVAECEADHSYPMTKVKWMPNGDSFLATCGDQLRLWQYNERQLSQPIVLNSNKRGEFCAPLTSFDWNSNNTHLLGTCSVDTTCTIWDIETKQIKTQLIAHDKEVYDMAFNTIGSDIFASVGADGSVRMFDLRNLEHSTIIYETADATPLLRLEWNKQDPNYLATIQQDSPNVTILDVRMPSVACYVLKGHGAAVNSIKWAPNSSSHLCSVGDDARALVWDVSLKKQQLQVDPILCFSASEEVNQLVWSSPEWVAISHGNTVEMLRV